MYNILKCSVMLISLGACSLIPGSGPFGSNVESGATYTVSTDEDITGIDGASQRDEMPGYVIIPLSSQTLPDTVAEYTDYRTSSIFAGNTRPAKSFIMSGDTLEVTIYESEAGGLFIPLDSGAVVGNYITLPVQIVSEEGTITVPYAGEIEVAGKTLTAASKLITSKLVAKAIEPQVLVTYAQRGGSEVSVIGEVNQPTKFALATNGERILDALARAGGPRYPDYESLINIQRGEQSVTLPLTDFFEKPELNVFLQPMDIVYVTRKPKTFATFGATGDSNEFNFDKKSLTLSEAIAKSRGLRDFQADPSEIYVYRLMDSDQLPRLDKEIIGNSKRFPVLYNLDLRKPDGYFLAQKFEIADNDVIYIGNAKTVELSKFLNLLNLSASTTSTTYGIN